MAKQNKITRKELEMLINEELNNLDEGFLDRMMAKISATGSGAGASVGNIAKKIANPVRRLVGQPELKELDPKLVKQMTVLTKRMNKAGKQIAKVYNDIWNDYQTLRSSMDDKVRDAAAEVIEPVLGQANEAAGAMVAVGSTFGKAIANQAAKGTAKGTERSRGAVDAEPAMAENKQRK
jgi:hypothetical protein